MVIKITFTIRDEDCNNFTEPSKERIRNEVIGTHIHALLPSRIFVSFFCMSSNIIGDKLVLNFSAKFPLEFIMATFRSSQYQDGVKVLK